MSKTTLDLLRNVKDVRETMSQTLQDYKRGRHNIYIQNFKTWVNESSLLEHPQWWMLHLFITRINKHPHCGEKIFGAYREGWLYKHPLSL